MQTIVAAVVGWVLVGVGVEIIAASDQRHTTDGGWLILAGLVLIIARAIAVRFDRIYPPK